LPPEDLVRHEQSTHFLITPDFISELMRDDNGAREGCGEAESQSGAVQGPPAAFIPPK